MDTANQTAPAGAPESGIRQPAPDGRPASACSVNQGLVDAIIKRAEASQYGLEKPERSVRMDRYEPHDLSTLALALVSGWHAKYDLVSVFAAALQEVSERSQSTK